MGDQQTWTVSAAPHANGFWGFCLPAAAGEHRQSNCIAAALSRVVRRYTRGAQSPALSLGHGSMQGFHDLRTDNGDTMNGTTHDADTMGAESDTDTIEREDPCLDATQQETALPQVSVTPPRSPSTPPAGVTATYFSFSAWPDDVTELLYERLRESASQRPDDYAEHLYERVREPETQWPDDTDAEYEDDLESVVLDEGFDAPHMFEYTNNGTRIEYPDTDIDTDLERSLSLHEVLEYEDEFWEDVPDAILAYRNEQLEDNTRITEADVRQGMDMQGIRWKQSMKNARNDYRQYRISTYENYFNFDGPFRGSITTQKGIPNDRSFLKFVQNELEHKCSLVHFQLRNLLIALNQNRIYHTDPSAVKVYNPLDRSCRVIMDLSQKSHIHPFKISSLAVTEEYCCVGGFFGDYALRRLGDETAETHIGLLTSDTTAITNHLCSQVARSGIPQLLISSNDSCLRAMDVATLKTTREHYFEHPLNCSATSSDKRIQVLVGDHCSAMLLDAENGQILKTIAGHTDYSFACAWSSDGHTFATGSQDLTTRLYDARGNTDTPIAIYRAKIGAIRSLKFSECGRFLAVAEPADFVNLHDMRNPTHSQCIDLFGEISGIDFTGDSFFIGNADKVMGGIAEYEFRKDDFALGDIMI